MSVISEKLNIINNAKNDIKTAIENKGVVVGDVSISDYASKINEISSGGADFEITHCMYLFYSNARIDSVNELCSLISKDCQYFQNMCENSSKLTEIPYFDMSNCTSIYSMFKGCSNLTTIPKYNIASATSTRQMFSGCSKLVEVPELDLSSSFQINEMFYNCTALTTMGGLKNVGKGFTQKSNNYSTYTLDLHYSTKLTHDSLMNVINNLYDLNLTYDVANGGTLYTQQLVLGAENIAKLSSDEINIAVSKGWVVS